MRLREGPAGRVEGHGRVFRQRRGHWKKSGKGLNRVRSIPYPAGELAMTSVSKETKGQTVIDENAYSDEALAGLKNVVAATIRLERQQRPQDLARLTAALHRWFAGDAPAPGLERGARNLGRAGARRFAPRRRLRGAGVLRHRDDADARFTLGTEGRQSKGRREN